MKGCKKSGQVVIPLVIIESLHQIKESLEAQMILHWTKTFCFFILVKTVLVQHKM